MKIVGVSGSLSSPSRTSTLVDLIVGRIAAQPLAKKDFVAIGDLAPRLGLATDPRRVPAEIAAAFDTLAAADLLVVGTPVYKGSYTGLLKHFFDLLDPKALAGKVAVLAATGGSDHHSLVLEHQLRPLLSFFNAYTVPTTIYAKDADFLKDEAGGGYRLNNPELLRRVDTIAGQASWLLAERGLQAIAA
jgi:FMN reductase